MDKFKTAWTFTGRSEAGWADNPGDRGGETIFGISRNAHPNHPIWVTVDARKQQSNFPASVNTDPALIQMAVDTYRTDYWNAVHGDELPTPMAVAVFDMAVNFNPGTATKRMQISLGVVVDGIIGPRTVKAAYDQGLYAVKRFLVQRVDAYLDDVRKHPSDEQFLSTWFYRVMDLMATCAILEKDETEKPAV